MSPASISPVAKALYLCDGHIGFANQKTDLIGLFSTIRPAHYPHAHKYFVVFAQLTAGLGQVPVYIDIRNAAQGTLVRTTAVQSLHFPHRDKLIQLAYAIRDCTFPQPGVYLVELFCNGNWVADTTLERMALPVFFTMPSAHPEPGTPPCCEKMPPRAPKRTQRGNCS